MKNNLLFSLLISLMFWSACSNDFEVVAPWKDIPIVYGLLNIADDQHYIRVEKAFIDPDISALVIAKEPDSLYYDNVIVQLEKVSTGQIFTLTRVDGNDPGIALPRDPGIFATVPNYLYRIEGSAIDLQKGEIIRLIVDRGNGLPLVTAETAIQGPMQKRTPGGNNFDFVPNLPTKLGWSASTESKIFDVKLIIHYGEFPKDDPSAFEQKTIEWVWANGVTFSVPANEYRLEKDGKEFYAVMASNIPNDPNFERIFIDMDLEIISGGEALQKYINVALANSGITGSQELPSFTNLSEGMGIFSTQGVLKVPGLLLAPKTRDSLANGSITKHLNFQ